MRHEKAQSILAIAQSFDNLSPPLSNVYWLMRQFILRLESMNACIPEMVQKVKKCLEEKEGQLFSHLTKTGAIDCLPLENWFNRCFAGILPEIALIRFVKNLLDLNEVDFNSSFVFFSGHG